MLAQRNALYGGGRPMPEPSLSSSALEQPVAARPSPVNSDYLSWTATAAYSPVMGAPHQPGQYSPMGAHTMPPQSSPNTSSSCALAGNASYSMASPPPPVGGHLGVPGGGGHHNPAVGMAGGIGSSIASLRLKAQEYNMQQTRYPIPHQMAQ